MRKTIAIALTLLSTTSMAQTKSPIERMCEDLGTAAYMIMQDRQDGEKKSEMMKIHGQGLKPDVRDLLKSLVDRAYRVPIKGDAHDKFFAANDFEDQVYEECLKSPPKW